MTEKTMTQTALAGQTKTASIVKLLEIERRWVLPDERASLVLAQEVWDSEGRPATLHELAALLERVLRLCVAEGILYAPVLLLRKKSLQRGTWRPKTSSEPPTPASAPPASSAAPQAATAPAATEGVQDGETCARCSGTGLYTSSNGMTGYLCPCGSYLRNLKLQKQPAQSDAGLAEKTE